VPKYIGEGTPLLLQQSWAAVLRLGGDGLLNCTRSASHWKAGA